MGGLHQPGCAIRWLTELRTAPQGHAVYRQMAWEMYAQAVQAHPAFKPLFGFVSPLDKDKVDQHRGRLAAENRSQTRQAVRQAVRQTEQQGSLLPEQQLSFVPEQQLSLAPAKT